MNDSAAAQPGVRPTRATWIEIDRRALAANVAQLRRIIGPQRLLAAVVKANAYGHGAVPVAHVLAAVGADRFAVAAPGEALELRASGIRAPILILSYTPLHQAAAVVAADVTAAVFDWECAQALDHAAAAVGRRAVVHVKVNTGMNRLGLTPADAPAFLAALAGLPHLEVEGIFTHFATSDTDRAFATEQFARFVPLLEQLRAAGLRPPIAHAANSAATLAMPETHLEMVRCGIALYGLDPDEDGTPIPPGFQPVMAWKAQVVQVTALAPGDSVSYGREFIAARPSVVAVIPVGYADGFPRRPHTWGSVLLHGTAVPIVGRVCMDHTILDVTGLAAAGQPVRVGDEAVLLGRQGNCELSAEEVGRRLGTINYDVVSRILARVPRIMVDGRSA